LHQHDLAIRNFIPRRELAFLLKKLADSNLPFLAGRITARSHDLDQRSARRFTSLWVSATLRLQSLV